MQAPPHLLFAMHNAFVMLVDVVGDGSCSGAVPLLLDGHTARAAKACWLELAVAVELVVPLKAQTTATAALKGKGAIAIIDVEVDTARVVATTSDSGEVRADVGSSVCTVIREIRPKLLYGRHKKWWEPKTVYGVAY